GALSHQSRRIRLIASVSLHQPSREPRLFYSLAQLVFSTSSLRDETCEVSRGVSSHQPTPSFLLQHVHVASSCVFSTRLLLLSTLISSLEPCLSFPLAYCFPLMSHHRSLVASAHSLISTPTHPCRIIKCLFHLLIAFPLTSCHGSLVAISPLSYFH